MIATNIAFASPNLRGSAISHELNDTVRFTSNEIIHRVTSRNLRGSTSNDVHDNIDTTFTQGILEWTLKNLKYPISKALDYLFPNFPQANLDFYNDDVYMFDEYSYDEHVIMKEWQLTHSEFNTDSNDDKAIDSIASAVDNNNDDETEPEDDQTEDIYYLTTGDDYPLYFLDYYNDDDDYGDRNQKEDFYSDGWFQKLNTSIFSLPNKQQEVINDNSANDSSATTKSHDSIVPTPVIIRNLHLRGSTATIREKEYSLASKTSETCNCIIPEEECNPDHFVCPLNYDPVCGCDNKTYANGCEARYFGCNRSWKPGRCHGNLRATQG
jgi:hypothetical protein